jgi:hypothetical protein
MQSKLLCIPVTGLLLQNSLWVKTGTDKRTSPGNTIQHPKLGRPFAFPNHGDGTKDSFHPFAGALGLSSLLTALI